MLVRGVKQRVEERRIDACGREHRLHHLVAERAAQRDPAGAAGDALGRRQHARRQDAHVDARKQAPADLAGQAGERRELHTVDAHRQQRGLGALGDDRRPLVHLHQRPGGGDAPFGKDDAGRAGFHRADHRADGQRVRRIDRQRVDEDEERLRPPLLRDLRVDGKNRIAGQECPEQQAIEKRRVIGGDDRLRQRLPRVLEPLHAHAIEESEDQAQQALCHRPPQDPRRRERDRDGQQSAQREELAHRPAAAEKQGGRNRSDRHRQGVDDVVGRDHARAVRRLAFVLQDRVERHREETARHRHANEIHDNPPASRRAQEDGYGRQFRDCRAASARRVEVPGEERHRGGGDGHEARADFAVQEPLGQNRSDADADREERQHHRHDLLVRAEHVLGKGGQSRDHGGAKQPEPGHREDRQEQGWTRRHVADDRDRVASRRGRGASVADGGAGGI